MTSENNDTQCLVRLRLLPSQSVSMSSLNSDRPADECHALPCSIDFKGKAPAHIFFQPTKLNETLLVSTFRGRGLLASKPTESIEGRLLTVDHQGQVKTTAAFTNITEWHHEHQPAAVQQAVRLQGSRVQQATEWCRIANALHAPIPVEEE